jgi:hypothetical protein
VKTTIELPDELLIRAKQRAAELRRPLRALVEAGLRRELEQGRAKKRERRTTIRWVTAPGGLPNDLDVADRERMHDWLQRHL